MNSFVFNERKINASLFVVTFLVAMFIFLAPAKAAVPYTYLTTIDDKNQASIEVTFDYSVNLLNKSLITVFQVGEIEPIRHPEISDVSVVDGNKLKIKVAELDPGEMNYEIKIKKGALKFGDEYFQFMDFTLPFCSSDFAKGFKEIFMQKKPDELNKEILDDNSPRDIKICIPRKYITKIETIHKKDGMKNPSSDEKDKTSYTKLTNVDVITTSEIKRLKISISVDGEKKLENKELVPSTNFKGFTTGRAGLDIYTGKDYTIEIKAYDISGRLLEDSSYTKKVQDKEIVSDYITSKSSSNKDTTLYDLMKNPNQLESLLQAFDVDNLNEVKVVYPNTKETRLIKDTEKNSNDAPHVFAEALSNADVKYFKFAEGLNIDLGQSITISRPIVLDGNNSTLKGNIIIENENKDIYELRNVTIDGDLTINLSDEGDCILKNVKITGKKIVKNKRLAEVIDVAAKENKTLYKIGDEIKIGVKFNEPVFVIGEPQFKFNVGSDVVVADYDEKSTNAITTGDEVVFKYTIKQGNNDSIISTDGEAIDLNGGDIQAKEGKSNATVDFTGANKKLICSSVSKEDIEIDTIRPMYSECEIKDDKTEIVIVANDIMDITSTENKNNWKIDVLANNQEVQSYTPQKVVLQGNQKTVVIELPNECKDVAEENILVLMMPDVKDKAGNGAENDIVVLNQDSLGIAWKDKIVGLGKGKLYKITKVAQNEEEKDEIKYVKADGTLVDEAANVAPLEGTQIKGLTNREKYKVEEVSKTILSLINLHKRIADAQELLYVKHEVGKLVGNVSQEVHDMLKEAITQALKVEKDVAEDTKAKTPAEIDKVASDLNSSIDEFKQNIISKGDPAKLETAIEDANKDLKLYKVGTGVGDVSREVHDTLEKAINAAEAILKEAKNKTEEELNQAEKSLRDAIHNFNKEIIKTLDIKSLEETIKLAERELKKCKDEDLSKAKNEAQHIVDIAATKNQEEIDEAIKVLEDAIDVFKAKSFIVESSSTYDGTDLVVTFSEKLPEGVIVKARVGNDGALKDATIFNNREKCRLRIDLAKDESAYLIFTSGDEETVSEAVYSKK